MARKDTNLPVEVVQAQVVESSSALENMGMGTIASLLGQIVNYYVSDQPYRAELSDQLASLQRSIDQVKNQLEHRLSLADERLLEQAQEVVDQAARRDLTAGR